MVTFLVILQLFIVLALIFIGARVGGIGLGIYGMVGVFILVFIFGLEPGAIPIDVMLIIVSVITASAALQGNKEGRFSIRANDQYRIEFTLTETKDEPVVTICNIVELSNHYK